MQFRFCESELRIGASHFSIVAARSALELDWLAWGTCGTVCGWVQMVMVMQRHEQEEAYDRQALLGLCNDK